MNGTRGSSAMLQHHRRGHSVGSARALVTDRARDRDRSRDKNEVPLRMDDDGDGDEDLALFHEMRRREKEKERQKMHLLSPSVGTGAAVADLPNGAAPTSMPIPVPRRRCDDLLGGDGEVDKNDYDWLLTPPDTPLFTSLEMESPADQRRFARCPVIRPLSPALKDNKPIVSEMDSVPKNLRNGFVSRQTVACNNSMHASSRKPAMSCGSRPATPTSRPTMSSASRSTSTTTTRTAAPSSRPRPSTPTARHSHSHSVQSSSSSSRPPALSSGSRPSTPTARPTLLPSTAARSTIPPIRSSSRPATPTRRPISNSSSNSASDTSNSNLVSATKASLPRSASVGRAAAGVSRNANAAASASSRGCSPTVKSRSWQPCEMPGFSVDAPPNLRTSMPERPISATRGRPGAASGQPCKEDAASRARSRRQSCSPSSARGRLTSDSLSSGRSIIGVYNSKSHSNGNDVLGSKMVEKLMYARRAASKLQDDQMSSKSSSSVTQATAKRPVKPSISSPDSSGFGRSLSKKSLDMAIRHMDIRRSVPNTLRPSMNSASSLYSVRSLGARRRPGSISDSPIATSSNASSEYSMNVVIGPEGSELDDEDFGSEKGSKASPAASQQGSLSCKGEPGIASSNWMHLQSLDFKDSKSSPATQQLGSAHSKADPKSATWLHSLDFKDSKLDEAFLYNNGNDITLEQLEEFVCSKGNVIEALSKARLE